MCPVSFPSLPAALCRSGSVATHDDRLKHRATPRRSLRAGARKGLQATLEARQQQNAAGKQAATAADAAAGAVRKKAGGGTAAKRQLVPEDAGAAGQQLVQSKPQQPVQSLTTETVAKVRCLITVVSSLDTRAVHLLQSQPFCNSLCQGLPENPNTAGQQLAQSEPEQPVQSLTTETVAKMCNLATLYLQVLPSQVSCKQPRACARGCGPSRAAAHAEQASAARAVPREASDRQRRAEAPDGGRTF